MNRISQKIIDPNGKKLLIPFFTVGYPNLKRTLAYVKAAEAAGADVIELGVPFSDPMADGPEIQFSSRVALDNGIGWDEIFALVKRIRKSSEIPIVLMGYFNPIIALGFKRFLKRASLAGVDGLIIPDLPIDEAVEFNRLAKDYDISMTYLAAPTSGTNRIKKIDRLTSGFVYAVTVTGVTGSGKGFSINTVQYFKQLKANLTKKFVAGFGISTVADAKKMAGLSDGIVIGSKLVKIIRNCKGQSESVNKIGRFIKSLRQAIDE